MASLLQRAQADRHARRPAGPLLSGAEASFSETLPAPSPCPILVLHTTTNPLSPLTLSLCS